jgi:hypothetical protein
MQLLYNNYTQTVGHGPTWGIQIHTSQTEPSDFFTESKRAAEIIWSAKQGTVYVMYSGGVDSEYTLKLFHSLGMSVIPVIIKLNPSYNEHDIKYAIDFCEAHGLTPLIIDIDFDEFVRSGKIIDIAESVQLCVYQYAATLYATANIDGTVICSTGEPSVRLDSNAKQWSVIFDEYNYVFFNYWQTHGVIGTPFFTTYTPEMMFSFISDPRVNDLVNFRVPGKQGHQSSKWLIYNRHSGFNHRERPKYHGYENIEHSEIGKHANILAFEEFKTRWNGQVTQEYHTFISKIKDPVISL